MEELKKMVGKEIQIYPGDSKSKFGILTEVNDHGMVINITKSSDLTSFPLGLMYFSHTTSLRFSLIKK